MVTEAGTREDDTLGLHPVERGLGGLEGGDLAVDAGLADAAGDQLGYLAAEIDDENAVWVLHVGRIAGWRPQRKRPRLPDGKRGL